MLTFYSPETNKSCCGQGFWFKIIRYATVRAYNLTEKHVNVVIVLVVSFQILVGKQDNPSHTLVLYLYPPHCNLVDTR